MIEALLLKWVSHRRNYSNRNRYAYSHRFLGSNNTAFYRFLDVHATRFWIIAQQGACTHI